LGFRAGIWYNWGGRRWFGCCPRSLFARPVQPWLQGGGGWLVVVYVTSHHPTPRCRNRSPGSRQRWWRWRTGIRHRWLVCVTMAERTNGEGCQGAVSSSVQPVAVKRHNGSPRRSSARHEPSLQRQAQVKVAAPPFRRVPAANAASPSQGGVAAAAAGQGGYRWVGQQARGKVRVPHAAAHMGPLPPVGRSSTSAAPVIRHSGTQLGLTSSTSSTIRLNHHVRLAGGSGANRQANRRLGRVAGQKGMAAARRQQAASAGQRATRNAGVARKWQRACGGARRNGAKCGSNPKKKKKKKKKKKRRLCSCTQTS